MPGDLHLELDALSEFLVDEAGRRLRIQVPHELEPASQRLMDFLGVEVEVTATAGGVSCIIGGCDWRFDGEFIDRISAIEEHRAEEHAHIPEHKFSVRSDSAREALQAMDDGLTQRELRSALPVSPPPVEEPEPEEDEPEPEPEPEPEAEEEVETVPSRPQWTQETCIQAIKDWAAEHGGRPPTNRDFIIAAEGRPSTGQVKKLFGSWATAIAAAGFPAPTRGGNTRSRSSSRSSVREPKAREAAALSGPPPAKPSTPPPRGGDAVVDESPGPRAAEAGSRTDEYAEWLAAKIDVDQLQAEMDEYLAQAFDCQRKAQALRQIIAAVKRLEEIDEAA